MKITLTTWERIQLAIVVSSGRAPTIGAVDLGLKALGALNLSNVEKAKVSWDVVGVNQIACDWEHEHELEFDDDVWQMVQALVQAPQSWPIDERTKPMYDKVLDGKVT